MSELQGVGWIKFDEGKLEEFKRAANLGELGPAILATGSATSALIGEPSADLRATLAGGPVRLFMPFVSM